MKKMIQFIIVGVILIVSYATYIFVHPENWIKNNDTISAAAIAENPLEDYAGKLPEADIPLLQSAEEFAAMTSRDFVTVSPSDVIPTGVYELKGWLNANDLKKASMGNGRMTSTGRTVPRVTTNAMIALDYYNEYYLIKLPDGGYIPALFDSRYIAEIKSGADVRLPVGKCLNTTTEALSPLLSAGKDYDVDPKSTLYMFDNGWYDSIDNKVFWIKLGIAFGVFAVQAVGAAVVFKKVFTE